MKSTLEEQDTNLSLQMINSCNTMETPMTLEFFNPIIGEFKLVGIESNRSEVHRLMQYQWLVMTGLGTIHSFASVRR